MYRIYTKELQSKEVFNINLNSEELQKVMGGNIFLDHPELNPQDYIIVEQVQPFVCPIYHSETNTIDEATREERILVFNEIELLQDGEYVETGKIITVPAPENLLKKVWDKELHIWKEGATEEEITKHVGENVTKLLFEALEKGVEVTVNGIKHLQSLSDNKRKALNEQISAINLSLELNDPIIKIPWPFKDDGTDTVIIPVEDFKKMALEAHKKGQDYYIAAELLKAKRKINASLEDFFAELKNVNIKTLENL